MSADSAESVIRFRGVARRYEMGDQVVNALDGVDLDIRRNEYVAIIGASRSGKSTLMNIIGCLDRPTEGEYQLEGHDVGAMNENELARVRNREIGFVFQSFNLLPRANALKNVMQPLVFRGIKLDDRKQKARQSLERVGLGDRVDHLPNQLSGGQRQRVAIARALAPEPRIMLLDEPTSALDVSVQAEILNLLSDLRADFGLTYLMVSHDLGVVGHMCGQIAVMQQGEIVEELGVAQMRRLEASHPYTRHLLESSLGAIR